MSRSQSVMPLTQARVLAGAVIGLVGGFTTVFFATSSQFIRPITEEFGWGRTELSLVVVLAMVGSAVASPPAGALVQRFGPRPVVAVSGALLAAGLVGFAAAPPSRGYFAVLALLVGLLGVGTTPVALLAVVPRYFDRRLGLALGVVMGGSAFGAAAMQITVGQTVADLGWRSAYQLLALVAVVLTGAALVIGFPRGAGPTARDSATTRVAREPGLEIGEVLRWPAFRLMMAALFLAAVGTLGFSVHFVSFITDRGISPQTAAGAAAVGGIGVAIGRILSGALLDRLNGLRVTGVIFTVAGLGFAIPALLPSASVVVYAGAALIGGFALGAEGDIIPFLVRRYAGVRAYAPILGLVLGVYTLGGAAGPVLFGLSFDRLGSYVPALWISAAAIVAAAGMMQLVGPYRFPDRPRVLVDESLDAKSLDAVPAASAPPAVAGS